jgi:hypothetical protein
MSPKIKICKEAGCVSEQTTDGFCRLHYLKNWKIIRTEKKNLAFFNKPLIILLRPPPIDARYFGENLRSPSISILPPPVIFKDDFDDVMDELGYKEDLTSYR